MKRDRLFDRPRKPPRPQWHGRHDIVRWPTPKRCPDGRRPLRADSGADALALFWMHGFGAVVRTTFATCACGYRRHWTTQTITPRDRPQLATVIRGPW